MILIIKKEASKNNGFLMNKTSLTILKFSKHIEKITINTKKLSKDSKQKNPSLNKDPLLLREKSLKIWLLGKRDTTTSCLDTQAHRLNE